MTTPLSKVLVIIPAYNEQESIAGVISSVRSDAPEVDLVVINDGSSDDTAQVARALGVKVLDHLFNLGIGATMQTGYKYANRNGYDIAVQFDGDGQHPAHQITDLIGPVLRRDADVVVGSRFIVKGDYKPSISRGAGMVIFSRLVSLILKEKVTDTTSGFRAVGKDVIAFFSRNYPDDYPEVEALVLLHKKGFRIVEIPVTMMERKGGRSSITPSRSVYYMVKVMLAIFVDLLRRTEK
ncbi:MAG: glycosyltransferase family 2 protein [Thermodesulfobacteriota bacterium]